MRTYNKPLAVDPISEGSKELNTAKVIFEMVSVSSQRKNTENKHLHGMEGRERGKGRKGEREKGRKEVGKRETGRYCCHKS